jgi:hypothetical protein
MALAMSPANGRVATCANETLTGKMGERIGWNRDCFGPRTSGHKADKARVPTEGPE